jgi:hypothetical protein
MASLENKQEETKYSTSMVLVPLGQQKSLPLATGVATPVGATAVVPLGPTTALPTLPAQHPAFFSADFNNQGITDVPVFRVQHPNFPVLGWTVTTDPADPTHPMNTINFPVSLTHSQYFSVAAQITGVVMTSGSPQPFLEIIFTLAPSTAIWHNSNNTGPQNAQASGFVNSSPVAGDTRTCGFAPAIVFVPPGVQAQLQCEPGVFGQDQNYTIQTSTEFGQGVSGSWISINRIAII